jgi:hypothetical protein
MTRARRVFKGEVVTLMTLWFSFYDQVKEGVQRRGQDHADLNDIVVNFYNHAGQEARPCSIPLTTN